MDFVKKDVQPGCFGERYNAMVFNALTGLCANRDIETYKTSGATIQLIERTNTVLSHDHIPRDTSTLDKMRLTKSTKKETFVTAAIRCEDGTFLNSCRFRVYNIGMSWRIRRLLWVTFFKEDSSYCNLAKLPMELMCHLESFIRDSPIQRKHAGKRKLEFVD
jgi:hypothetical protein